MQVLTPPEKVELSGWEVKTQWTYRNAMYNRTGSHIPQRAIQLARSSQTNALAGTHKRLDPTDLGSCNVNDSVSAMSRRWFHEKNVQVVSSQRQGERGSFGNW